MGVVTMDEIESFLGVGIILYITAMTFLAWCSTVMFLFSHLVKALLFTCSGFFVNPACASPEDFVQEGGCLKEKDPSATAVCIMTGVISKCSIVAEGVSGAQESIKAVHKVSILPFHQDFRHDTTFLGIVFQFNAIAGSVSADGIAFTMRPKPLFPVVSSCKLFFVLLLDYLICMLHRQFLFCTYVLPLHHISATCCHIALKLL
jgi:hypothetical protein